MESRYDVVVVGAGGSGLAAAARAAERGARVIALERRPQPGGTTGIAIGSFTASGTRHQRRAGIDDAAAAHAVDAGRFAPPEIESRNNAALRDRFLAHHAETLVWLERCGLTFHGPSPEPPNRVPRMHNAIPGGRAYIAILAERLRAHGGLLRCGTAVEELMFRGGRVAGVVACAGGSRERFVAERGVVLAAGDYAGASDLIARYKGAAFAAIGGINPHATGDGHRLAASAGGALVNMDVTYGPELRFVAPGRGDPFRPLPGGAWAVRLAGWLLPWVPDRLLAAFARRLLVTWQHPENALLADGALLVNRLGARFTAEERSPDREIALARQPGAVGYLLLDGRLVARYSAWPHFVSTAPQIAYAYVSDYLRLRPDVAVRGERLEDVAERRGLPGAALRETVAQYNSSVRDGRPDRHGRSRCVPLDAGPWVLLGPVKAYFTTTEGGAAIDERLRVLDGEGRPIAGLLAVGQNGLGGQILWGHGLHIAWAITSGRIAGEILTEGAS